ncbi:MAG: hypothetical protein FJ189_07815 [Gammaproteobacteria bacterium]|nr:hypothetical protein [Gammaproteobacteria bacterium]
MYPPDRGLLKDDARQRNLCPEIARLFLIHALGVSGALQLVLGRRYTLERLRDVMPFPIAPEDAYRFASAELMEVRFAGREHAQRIQASPRLQGAAGPPPISHRRNPPSFFSRALDEGASRLLAFGC